MNNSNPSWKVILGEYLSVFGGFAFIFGYALLFDSKTWILLPIAGIALFAIGLRLQKK